MSVGDPEPYQDVPWGPGKHERPATDNPCTFKRLQLVMNSGGYFLCKQEVDGDGKGIFHFENTKTGKVITILAPDFSAVGYDLPVYDMAYVLDLLPKIVGQESPEAGHKLIATLRSVSNNPY